MDEVTKQRMKKCAREDAHDFIDDYNDDAKPIKVCIKCGLSIVES